MVQGAKFYKVVVSNFRVGDFQTRYNSTFQEGKQRQNNFRFCDPP